MNILLLGATGGIGQAVLQEALSRDCKIFALVRSPWKMIDYEGKVTIIQGDATKTEDITKAIAQVDVVIHCVSVPLQHEKPSHLYSETTQAIIDARPQGSAKHLIVMSSTGTHHGRKLPRPANFAYEKMLGDVADDKELEEELLQKSLLPRTVIKSPLLTNTEVKDYVLTKFEEYKPSIFDIISRKTVAKAIVDIAFDGLHIGEKVVPLVISK